MRPMRFLLRDFFVVIAAAFFLVTFRADSTRANPVPADVCSLITPQQLEKMLGEPFGAPEKTVAVAAYKGQAPGTSCRYTDTKAGRRNAQLIVYVDGSADEAKQTFMKLSAFYPAEMQQSGIGDSAYMDKSHNIHVLKGNVRFYITVSGSTDAEREKHARDLAVSVAGQL